jgi:hypothetical protein
MDSEIDFGRSHDQDNDGKDQKPETSTSFGITEGRGLLNEIFYNQHKSPSAAVMARKVAKATAAPNQKRERVNRL